MINHLVRLRPFEYNLPSMDDPVTPMSGPLNVFISWSGKRSKFVAETLRDWLPCVFPNLVQPFTSSHDIDAGGRSMDTLAERLEQSTIGIVCLTNENLKSPWVHFEAGAISKAVKKAFVCTYLIDMAISDVGPPLSLFQASKADQEGTLRVVNTVNTQLGESGLPARLLEQTYKVWWEELASRLQQIPNDTDAHETTRPEKDVLEELVGLTRQLAQSLPGTFQSGVAELSALLTTEIRSGSSSSEDFLKRLFSMVVSLEHQQERTSREIAGILEMQHKRVLAEIQMYVKNLSNNLPPQ
jgi:hypothetical protein